MAARWNFPALPKIWLGYGVVVVVLLFAAMGLVQQELEQNLIAVQEATRRELNLIDALVADALRRGQYQSINSLLQDWAAADVQVTELRVTGRDGLVLGAYQRERPLPIHALSMTSPIEYSYRGHATLSMVREIDEVYTSNMTFRIQLLVLIAAISGLLGAVFFLYLKYRQEAGLLRLRTAMLDSANGSLRRTQQQVQEFNIELEQRVRERTRELEVANKELDAFAYSVSHDLRSPLRAIDGYVHVLAEDSAPQLDAHGRMYLERVSAATQRMGTLIDDLLQLSRMTRQEMMCQDLNLSGIAQEIFQDLSQHDPERKVELHVAVSMHAHGDARLMRVVLDNLLRNAWKYTSKTVAARIEFGCTSNAGEPVYFVRDNGAGFDTKFAGKLFGAFQRLHKAEDFPGTGVGLATAARIIHRHGGRIWADAELNHGAVFYFTLPPANKCHELTQESA